MNICNSDFQGPGHQAKSNRDLGPKQTNSGSPMMSPDYCLVGVSWPRQEGTPRHTSVAAESRRQLVALRGPRGLETIGESAGEERATQTISGDLQRGPH